MIKSLLVSASIFLAFSLSAQSDCYKRLEDAFTKRGAYTIGDDMHSGIIISYFEKDGVTCVSGKTRVENGQIVSVFIQYDDNSYELMEKKFYNEKKGRPTITNGISEMIYTPDGEKFKIIFIEKLKPKQKALKEISLPDDL
jgi:hypothetical protein